MAEHNAAENERWWVISETAFREALRRSGAGEDPDLLITEHYANSDADDASHRDVSEREAVIREFESLADFWTLSPGWIGPVALHDFRRKIAALRGRDISPAGENPS